MDLYYRSYSVLIRCEHTTEYTTLQVRIIIKKKNGAYFNPSDWSVVFNKTGQWKSLHNEITELHKKH